MSPISCPTCGEKGNLPDHLIGKKLKCQKCHSSFVAGANHPATPTAHAATATAAAKPAGDSIEVDGLDDSSWTAMPTVAGAAVAVESPPRPPEHREPAPAPAPAPAFSAAPPEPDHAEGHARQYKVLTSKDRWFEGKFDLARLEEALNFYARQGWTVKGMATPHVTGFSGGPREELVILLER